MRCLFRRLLSLLLCMALLLSFSCAEEQLVDEGDLDPHCLAEGLLDPSGAHLTEQAAIDAALQALVDHHPEVDELSSLPYVCHTNYVMLTSGEPAWVCSIFGQQDETLIEAVVTFDDAGAILRYEENNTGWFRQAQAHWEEVLGRYGTWPLEKQVLFDMLYCLEVTHATLPDNFIPEDVAYDLALSAANLTDSRNTLHCERTLVFDLYAADVANQYVWMITICLGDQELAQVNISAIDAHIIDFFDFISDVG